MGASAESKAEFLAYAEHCEAMAASANEADKELWLRMAAAWRRQSVEAPRGVDEPD